MESKLLDVNARAWGFHILGGACGVDFPYLLYADRLGLPIEPTHAKSGAGWMRLLTDVPTAISDFVKWKPEPQRLYEVSSRHSGGICL